MTKQINIAFILFLIQFCPIIADISKDLSAESRGLKYYYDEENNGIPNVAGRKKREYRHDQHSQFPGAKAPENDGYNGPIIQMKKGNRKNGEQKFEVKQMAKKIFAIKVRNPMGFFKKKKTEQKTKINGPKNMHIPLLNIVKNQSSKLKGWKEKKFAKTKKHRQLTEKTKENKNEGKIAHENELEKIKITLDEAVEMIDQIQNIKKYTNYNKDEDKKGEERSEKLEQKTENSKEIHNYPPFDVEYFLGNAPKLDKKWSSDKNMDKKGLQKKTMEKSKSYFGLDLKMFKEKSFYIDKKTNIHSAVELFQHWGKHSSVQTINNEEDKKEGNEEGMNKTQHWSNKFMKLAKMIDEDCANIGPRKGKGENALCILGRLFTICLTIKEEIKDIEEFDEKFQGKIAEKLEWMRKGANDIFVSFKMDPKLEINKLVKKYNKLIQIKSEMRVDYDFNDYFLDNEPLKMREIPEEAKPIMNINKIGRIIGEKSAIEVGHSFKPILRTKDKKKTNFLPPDQKNLEKISFHENKLEQLSNFLKTPAENKMQN